MFFVWEKVCKNRNENGNSADDVPEHDNFAADNYNFVILPV